MAQNERGRGAHDPAPRFFHKQRSRKLVEEVFGWIRTTGAGGKLRYLNRPGATSGSS